MKQSIDTYINNIFEYRPKVQFIMLCGLQGSGKSSFSKKFKEKGYNVYSADEERYKLALLKKENKGLYESEINDLQSYSKDAIQNCVDQIIDSLKKGQHCVYDATNTSKKARANILNKIKSSKVDFETIAVFIDVKLETALERNIERANSVLYEDQSKTIYDRYVPENVIINKYRCLTLPFNEGFDRVFIVYNDKLEYRDGHLNDILNIKNSNDLFDFCDKNRDLINYMFPEYAKIWDFDQKNPHHNLTLDKHILSVAKQLQKEKIELFLAGFLHDIAKPYTQIRRGILIMDGQIFKAGEKVNIDKITNEGFVIVSKVDSNGYRSELLTVKHVAMNKHYNYYNHESVGALMARRYLIELGFTEEQCNLVYRYILYHMTLPIDEMHSNKTLNKVINNIGKDIIKDIIKIKVADKTSSNTSDDSLKNMYYNIDIINNLLK